MEKQYSDEKREFLPRVERKRKSTILFSESEGNLIISVSQILGLHPNSFVRSAAVREARLVLSSQKNHEAI